MKSGNWIALIAAAILAVVFIQFPDVFTPAEKTAKLELQKLSGSLSSAASFAADCERRIADKDKPGSYLRRQDRAACEAGFRRFNAAFESSPADVVERICAPEGYLTLKSKDAPIFARACQSRSGR